METSTQQQKTSSPSKDRMTAIELRLIGCRSDGEPISGSDVSGAAEALHDYGQVFILSPDLFGVRDQDEFGFLEAHHLRLHARESQVPALLDAANAYKALVLPNVAFIVEFTHNSVHVL